MEEEKKELAPKSEETSNKLTFNAWLKGIVHYKWWVIGGTLGLGLVGALGVQFGVNPLTEKLHADYNYNLATITDENGVERYVDGSVFNYAGIASRATLEGIKNSDEAFKKIDINKIIKESAISVTKTVEFKTDSTGATIPDSKSVKYTINVVAKYFPSKEVGRKFIEKMIYYPQTLSSQAIARYNVTSYIGNDFATSSYSKKVSALLSQYNGINNIYASLDDDFGGYVIGNSKGETLDQIAADFVASNGNIQLLVNSFYANGYVDYVEGQEADRIAEIKLEADANALMLRSKQSELQTNMELLNAMQSTVVSLQSESEYVREIIRLKNTISSLSKEIDQLVKDLHWAGYYLNESTGNYEFNDYDEHNACFRLANVAAPEEADWIARNAAFNAELIAASEALGNERNEATSTFRHLYSSYKNSVSVFNSGYIDIEGNIHWAIGLVGGLILGFLVSSFITGEVEINYKKKEKEAK